MSYDCISINSISDNMADIATAHIIDKYINLPTFVCQKSDQHGIKGDYFKCKIKAKCQHDNEEYFQLSNDKGDVLLIKATTVMKYLTDGGWKNNLIDEMGSSKFDISDLLFISNIYIIFFLLLLSKPIYVRYRHFKYNLSKFIITFTLALT